MKFPFFPHTASYTPGYEAKELGNDEKIARKQKTVFHLIIDINTFNILRFLIAGGRKHDWTRPELVSN